MTTNKAWDFIHLLRGNLKERWWQLLLTTLCVTYGFLRLSSQWHYWLVALWVVFMIIALSGRRKPQI